MSRMPGFVPALLLRLVLACGLAALLAVRQEEAQSPGMHVPQASAAAFAAPGEGAAAGGSERAVNLAAIIAARPLFDPRRTAPTQDAGARPPAPSMPRLTGIVRIAEAAQAIFETSRGSRPMVLREGDRISGLLILSIAPGEVTLQEAESARLLTVVPVRNAEGK